MTDQYFKEGVYMKPDGKLVTIEKQNDGSYITLDGRLHKSPLVRALARSRGEIPYAGWTSQSLKNMDWGPLKYLSKCEYLGEL